MKKKIKNQVNGEKKLLCFELGLQTALRPSDLIELKVKDVKSGIVRIRSKKRNKSLEIRLNDRVNSMVQNYIEFMEDDEKLFNWERTTLYRFMKKAAGELNLEENIGAYSIRKSRGYHTYIDSNYNLALVMELLQHDDAESTLHYIGFKKEEMQKELIEMDL